METRTSNRIVWAIVGVAVVVVIIYAVQVFGARKSAMKKAKSINQNSSQQLPQSSQAYVQ